MYALIACLRSVGFGMRARSCWKAFSATATAISSDTGRMLFRGGYMAPANKSLSLTKPANFCAAHPTQLSHDKEEATHDGRYAQSRGNAYKIDAAHGDCFIRAGMPVI